MMPVIIAVVHEPVTCFDLPTLNTARIKWDTYAGYACWEEMQYRLTYLCDRSMSHKNMLVA